MLCGEITELVEKLGPAFVSAVVAIGLFLLSRWQRRVAEEKLRHDLYDRRFAIYMAFHELLIAITEKSDADAELKNANAVRAHALFLLDPQLRDYLQKLHAEAFRVNETIKLVRQPHAYSSDPERVQTATQLAVNKLARGADRIPELAEQFMRFLKLNDFVKRAP